MKQISVLGRVRQEQVGLQPYSGDAWPGDSLLEQLGELLRCLSHLNRIHSGGIHILQCFRFTELDACWIAIAEVTLDDLPGNGVNPHSAKGAGCHAKLAPNTQVVIDSHPGQLFISSQSPYRAHGHAGR